MEEIDVWRSADILIKQHGERAAEVAAGKVVEYSKTEDAEGMTVWVQIMLAIRNLQKDKPSDGERPN